MECPNCSSHLVTLELADVEVDYCFACRGIWLDTGEIEHLVRIEGGRNHPLEITTLQRTAEKRRKCPLCRKRMGKILAGADPGVILDCCVDHGMWSDAGELRKILTLGCSAGFSNPLVRLLDDLFAARKGECA